MAMGTRVDNQSLRRIGAAVIRAGGSDDAEAKTVANHLVDANLAGHDSHGIGLLPQYVRHLMAGLIIPNTGVRLDVDGGMVLRFEGRRGYGGRVAAEAMDIAIKRCRQLGLVAMSLAGAHHIGRVGAFGEQAIAANLISIHFVNAVDHPPHRGAVSGPIGALHDQPDLYRDPRQRNRAEIPARYGDHQDCVGRSAGCDERKPPSR